MEEEVIHPYIIASTRLIEPRLWTTVNPVWLP